MTTREEIIAGLRAMVDWLAEHPDVPLMAAGSEIAYVIDTPGRREHADNMAELRRIADTLGVDITDSVGRPVKPRETHLNAIRPFGPVTYRAVHITAEGRAVSS